MPHSWIYKEIASRFCSFVPFICQSIIDVITSDIPNIDDADIYPFLIRHAPAGTSSKNIVHFY